MKKKKKTTSSNKEEAASGGSKLVSKKLASVRRHMDDRNDTFPFLLAHTAILLNTREQKGAVEPATE